MHKLQRPYDNSSKKEPALDLNNKLIVIIFTMLILAVIFDYLRLVILERLSINNIFVKCIFNVFFISPFFIALYIYTYIKTETYSDTYKVFIVYSIGFLLWYIVANYFKKNPHTYLLFFMVTIITYILLLVLTPPYILGLPSTNVITIMYLPAMIYILQHKPYRITIAFLYIVFMVGTIFIGVKLDGYTYEKTIPIAQGISFLKEADLWENDNKMLIINKSVTRFEPIRIMFYNKSLSEKTGLYEWIYIGSLNYYKGKVDLLDLEGVMYRND